MRPTVIVPFHKNVDHLRQSLGAIRRTLADAEVIVAADGVVDPIDAVANAHRATVVVVAEQPQGPATARNRAAAVANGDIFIFVDSDVVAAPGALRGMCDLLASTPSIAGVFGAYDRNPPAQNFTSQFKNLSHTYVHEVGQREASTFWAGLGAVRADAFRAVGGFDERFRRPSVEDIDLGYRLRAAGYRLRLDPTFRGTHLKHWTFAGCVMTDLVARGIPWTQLIHRFKALANDLNTSFALRASVVLAYGILLAALAAPFAPWAAVIGLALLLVLMAMSYDYYRWMAAQRGWLFALRVVPVHIVHHLCNGISFLAGTALYAAGRFGWVLPGSLPSEPWPATVVGVPDRVRASR